MDIFGVLTLIGGLALFLYGMNVMGAGLEKMSGGKLEKILETLTSNPIKAVLLGAGVTAVIQSSSATTVMVVGFVNSGIMKLSQAVGIIMGANIGTTVTSWLLSLSGLQGDNFFIQMLKPSSFSPILAMIGIILCMSKKSDKKKDIGEILLGFAVLMYGMESMSGAVEPLADVPEFTNILTMFHNPFLGVLAGAVLTAIIQSSSASVGILQALSVTGGISFAVALPIVMGIGVGAACPVLMSAIGTNKNGKRTALIYLLNDLFGMLFWSIVFYTLNAIFHFKFMNVVMTPVYIALMNTVFRAATICILSPFIKYIEKLVYILIKDDEEDLDEQKDFDLLEERFLNYPAIAIAQSHTAMNGMARKARKNLSRSVSLLKKYSDEKYQKIEEKEVLIDKYEDKLGTYLMQLTGKELSGDQTKQVSKFLHTISDFERMGDHALNVARTAKELYDKKIVFSDEARYELNVLIAAMKEIVTSTVQAFSRDDLQMAARIEPLRELIGMLCDELKMRHVDRLQSGKCGISQGFAFNDLLTNIERVSDHCSNVAVAMIELESRNFDTHEYLKSVREMRNTEYKRYFEEYEQKYSIDDFEAWSERQQEKEKMKALLEEQQLQQGRKSKNVGTAETIIPENIDPLEDPLEDTEEN